AVTDLEIESGSVRIRHGKGNKERYVPIGKRALFWVSIYVNKVRPQLARSADATELFLSADGTPLSPDGFGQRVRRYVKDSGVGKSGGCHLFRHTMATLMLEGGADVRHIQEMLGHESLESTQIYTRVSLRHLREVHERTHPAANLDRADVRHIQEMLGHESLESTQIYTRVSLRHLREVHERTHPAANLDRAPAKPDATWHLPETWNRPLGYPRKRQA